MLSQYLPLYVTAFKSPAAMWAALEFIIRMRPSIAQKEYNLCKYTNKKNTVVRSNGLFFEIKMLSKVKL